MQTNTRQHSAVIFPRIIICNVNFGHAFAVSSVVVYIIVTATSALPLFFFETICSDDRKRKFTNYSDYVVTVCLSQYKQKSRWRCTYSHTEGENFYNFYKLKAEIGDAAQIRESLLQFPCFALQCLHSHTVCPISKITSKTCILHQPPALAISKPVNKIARYKPSHVVHYMFLYYPNHCCHRGSYRRCRCLLVEEYRDETAVSGYKMQQL